MEQQIDQEKNQKIQEVLDKMSFLEKVNPDEDRKAFWVLYGPPNTGKSYIGLDMPNVLWINAERSEPIVKAKNKEIVQVSINANKKDLKDNLKKLGDTVRLLRSPDCPFDSVLIDSFTMVSKIVMQDIKDTVGDSGDRNSFKKWEMFKEKLQNIIYDFQALRQHVIFTCWEKIYESEEGIDMLGPAIDGSMKFEISYLFTDVYHTFVKEETNIEGGQTVTTRSYGIETQPRGKAVSKTKYSTTLEPIEILPDKDIFNYIHNKAMGRGKKNA